MPNYNTKSKSGGLRNSMLNGIQNRTPKFGIPSKSQTNCQLVGMPNGMSKECRMECQMKYLVGCHTEWQIICQKKCQMECPKES